MNIENTNDLLVIDTDKGESIVQEVQTFDLIDPSLTPLHKQLPEFDFNNPPVKPNEFASTLVETCKKYNGLGLSANQCGYEHRVFVMGSGDNYIACFNPKLISSEGEAHLAEGCLSFPLLQLRITRPKTITVEYQDWNGEVHTQTFTGLTARIFLHELDHMNGIMYTDKVKPLALEFGLKKLSKIHRKYFNPKMIKNNGKKTNTRHR